MKLFPNQLAAQTFAVLLIGITLLLGTMLFVYNSYVRITDTLNSPHDLARHVTRIVDLSQRLNPDEVSMVLDSFHYRGVETRLNDVKSNEVVHPIALDDESIRKEVLSNPRHFSIRVPVGTEHWMEIATHFSYPKGFVLQFTFAIVFWLLGIIMLCAWVVRRLTWPLAQFAQAAKRFAIDVDAPPMSVAGVQAEQEAAQAFNQMQRRIRQLLNDRTQMLAAISHDLRTPITRLKLRVEDLALNTDLFNKIQADLNDMEQMITSILTFARDEVRSEKATVFDWVALVESVCNDMTDIGHDIRFQSTVSRIIIDGRMTGLKRAITNIIDNALKYGDRADVTLSISDQYITLKVQDQGPGIPREDLEKVFLPFYRVDQARSPHCRGSGLGLAVSQDIIRAHHGNIDLINCQPRGLCATVNLPVSILHDA